MSYILDALRKAEAERERGAVPGVHAQQYALLPADDEATARSRTSGVVIGALVLALAGVLAWAFFGRDAPRRGVEVSAGNVSNAPAAAGASTLAPAAATGVGVTPIAAVALAAPSPAKPALADTAGAATGRAAAGTARPDAQGIVSAPKRAIRKAAGGPQTAPDRQMSPAGASAAATSRGERLNSAAPPVAPTSANGAASGPSNRIYAQAELPDAVRRELPKIDVSGSAYSNDAASRMLMISGQVFHEGDKLGPNLVLDKIKLRAAVLAFKGYRYEITY